MSKWRVGGKVPLNVYENDVPMFQCHTPEQAARIAALLNEGEANAALLKVMAYLDSISGDDFCCDLEMRAAFHPERLTEMEATAYSKLSIVYQAAHGFNPSNSCYSVHEDWRKKILEAAEQLDAAIAAAPASKEPRSGTL